MLKSSIVKRSVVVDRHKTSVSLEPAFWGGLKAIARRRNLHIGEMIAVVDRKRDHGNLSSALRLFVLAEVVSDLNEANRHIRRLEDIYLPTVDAADEPERLAA